MNVASSSSSINPSITTTGVQIEPPCDDNFTAAEKKQWSDFISEIFQLAIKRSRQQSPIAISHFFDFSKTSLTLAVVEKTVSWIAFPRIIKLLYPDDETRWKVADGLINSSIKQGRAVQDEYCEWSIYRDTTNKIEKVTFTCEGPEYWTDFLAKNDKDKVTKLYQENVNPNIQQSELFLPTGKYNPTNIYNNSTSKGAMHLIQRNNTLGAEIILAGDATVLRHDSAGNPITDQQALINCSKYGQPQRNSDPLIGYEVNKLVQQNGFFITLKNPVGLFFGDINTAGWKTPNGDGDDIKKYWKFTRGAENRYVRVVFQVPETESFKLGDITINDEPIRYGGQIADCMTVKLTAVADTLPLGHATVFPCVSDDDKKHFIVPTFPTRFTN